MAVKLHSTMYYWLSLLQAEYTEKIPFKIRKNAEYDLHLTVTGLGSEPQVEFDRTLVEFESVLPFSSGSLAEVTVTNPTIHPVEFYSLDYDKQYLLEEEVSGTIKP